eukprot:1131843-Lingulodinium_polyedra.AAC.1
MSAGRRSTSPALAIRSTQEARPRNKERNHYTITGGWRGRLWRKDLRSLAVTAIDKELQTAELKRLLLRAACRLCRSQPRHCFKHAGHESIHE